MDPATGTGDASQHEFTINSGTVSGTVANEPIPNDYGITATLSGSGTFKATGQISVPLSDYQSWSRARIRTTRPRSSGRKRSLIPPLTPPGSARSGGIRPKDEKANSLAFRQLSASDIY